MIDSSCPVDVAPSFFTHGVKRTGELPSWRRSIEDIRALRDALEFDHVSRVVFRKRVLLRGFLEDGGLEWGSEESGEEMLQKFQLSRFKDVCFRSFQTSKNH